MGYLNMDQLLLLQIVIGLLLQGVLAQEPCQDQSCYPEIGDLLIGRDSEEYLITNSTCGLDNPEKYCIISHLDDVTKCFRCDSRQQYDPANRQTRMSHRINNIVSTFRRDAKLRWWQADNGVENVYIQLNLEAEFRFTHLIMRFKTFRPAAMYIERSYTFGKKWDVYRYFSDDCARDFPGISTRPMRNISDVICDSRYSKIDPSTDGEVVLIALPPSLRPENPYSQEVQNLIKLTNLRIVFKRLHTLGDDKLGERADVNQKYYYAMYDMVVRGSCSCYGHASRCTPMPGQERDRPVKNMVYGKCECMHNTTGSNCERCKDFHNDLPWRPAIGSDINACRICNCNGHSTRCHFDASVYEATGEVSGGVCDECQHNTQGLNCEECVPRYYRDPNLRINDPNVCKSCNCDPDGSEDGGECETHTDPLQNLLAGRCICKAFVMGRRCDTCQDGYWNLRASNPNGCQRCQCMTAGTFGNRGCNKQTGQCSCKRYVTGRNCDRCHEQYWGLQANEPDGCKACDCDVGGALDNNCDQVTGQCNCRPYIGGRRCDRPIDGYFVPNLDYLVYEAEDELIAKGIGNTYIIIREPKGEVTWTGPGFMKVTEGDSIEFTINNIPMSMEYDIIVRYEPQMPDTWDDVRVTVIRPGPVDPDGRCNNVIPQDDLKALTLPRVHDSPSVLARRPSDAIGSSSSSSDVLIQNGDGSGDLESDDFNLDLLSLSESGQVGASFSGKQQWFMDGEGNLLEHTVKYGEIGQQGQRYYVVTPSSCLEEGVPYIIRLDFNAYRSQQATPGASILIDSIVLIPRTYSIPIFTGSDVAERMRDDFIRYQCREQVLSATHGPLPEVCRRYIFSISAIMQRQALECACERQGSRSGVCQPIGGQCECKNNIFGRNCDQCVPGTYSFGNDRGCIACNCDAEGSRDNLCDVYNGQCLCVSRNIVGRECDRCSRGYYNFPNCLQCQCNGRADDCDDQTGSCIQCRDNTGGPFCNRCAEGYYGDASPTSLLGCRPCFCPGGAGSGFQHTNQCRLDSFTNQVQCECPVGYKGPDCSTCDEGYFGNPNQPGGTCQPCQCNGNIDPRVPGSCDPVSGRCLKCIGNTEGDRCERCRDGYHGDALRQQCTRCVCNILGTNSLGGPCDHRTGQCPCLPNVIGLECDQCAPNHWGLALGRGCQFCDCDPAGSRSQQCNEFTGFCECLPGRGGRDCRECPDNYFGDPKVQCEPCNCNREGSRQMQCDRRTGVCECQTGVAGDKCDRCARGTTGDLPYCEPCGECFDDWDAIISDLKSKTHNMSQEADKIKIDGAPSAYDKEFREMERKIEEVERILAGTNITSADLDDIRNKINELRANLTASGDALANLDDELEVSKDRIEEKMNEIAGVTDKVDQVKLKAEELKNNATGVKALDPAGAYNLTLEAQRRSQLAEREAQLAMDVVADSEATRTTAQDLLDRGLQDYNRQYDENENALEDIQIDIDAMKDNIQDLNRKVCGRRVDWRNVDPPCDDVCGGAGCGRCGTGLSCDGADFGAVSKANKALVYAKDAEKLLQGESVNSMSLRDQVAQAQAEAAMAESDAQMARDEAARAKNISESARLQLQDLIQRITDFLTEDKAQPESVREIAEEVLAMTISLTPEEIRDLANQINETIRGLTDIDRILEDTKDDLDMATKLKQDADAAKKAAEDVLDSAKAVIEALQQAAISQDAAEIAIGDSETDIDAATIDLETVNAECDAGGNLATESSRRLDDLLARLNDLKSKYRLLEDQVKLATEEAEIAAQRADETEQKAQDLELKYNDTAVELNRRWEETQRLRDRADALRTRANNLYADYDLKLKQLQVVETEFKNNEKFLDDYSDQVAEWTRQATLYMKSIQEVARFHRTCTN